MTEPVETELNRAAYFALQGASDDYVRDLVRLLRSDDPIHPIVREALALTLEGQGIGGARLTLTGHKKTNDLDRRMRGRARDLEVGSFIQTMLAAGTPRKEAFEQAGEVFPAASEKTFEAALTLYRKARALADEWQEVPELKAFDRDALLDLCASKVS